MDIISNLIVKFNEKISTNFEELIKEMLFETFKSKNIYLLNKYIELENYMKINKFDYRNNIILFNDSFYKIINSEVKNYIYNNNKIFGITIQINNININNLAHLKAIFNDIHLLILDFSRFFNNFNDTEIAQIFMYFSDFVKNNPIEVFIFKDDT